MNSIATPHQLPLVSVVMCTYNGSKFIDEQIASILKQDYPNLELVIVDDCSTDDTIAKIENWQKEHPLIKLFKNETNLGYNQNFQKAIQLANGDYITIADQDDIWLPQKISKSVNAFSEEGIALVHCQNISLENGVLKHKKATKRIPMSGNDTRQLFVYGQIPGHAMMFKKALLQFIFPMPSGILYDLWISAVASCHGIVKPLNEALVYHRVHSHNFSLDKNSPSKKKELDFHETLAALATIEEMKHPHKQCLLELLELVNKRNQVFNSKMYFPLFKFLLKNRQPFFGHRKRAIPIISHLKHAAKISRINFIGKGKAF